MIIELGNHSAKGVSLDDAPKITTIHIPEADEHGLGGYTHEPGLKVKDLKDHFVDSLLNRQGITRLPEHEILVSALHPLDGAWRHHGLDVPAWVNVIPHHDGLTPAGRCDDIRAVLEEFWGVKKEKPGNFEDIYWTRFGAPGQGGPAVPEVTALYTNNGRVISNVNDGGGQVGATGQASASAATTLTTGSTYATNQWAGYRVVATVSATVAVWGNIVSNTNAANASVLTVDRWYATATPGGAAGSTPSATATFAILDGGYTSTWFVALATGVNAPAATDTSLSTNGNVEITTGGGGLIRKIAPYAQTSGVATRALTLTPVFTANGSDSLPATVSTIGVLCSMVVATAGTMKFETAVSPTATLSASGDQLTITETITGS